MSSQKKIALLIPFIILACLLGLLWRELFYAKPGELASALIGEPVPTFSLPTLNNNPPFFTEKVLRHRVTLLNVWASWCYACALEHPMLMKISQTYHIPIYSIDYKDSAEDARDWLRKKGNPYVMTGLDSNGDAAIDLGIYGTPETFVINAQGEIVYRHVGAITQEAWDSVLYPLIKQMQ